MSIAGGAGRKHLGERGYVPVRPPIDQKHLYEERARSLGISLGSWAVMRLAEAEHLPVPEYIQDEIARAKARREADLTQPALDIDDGRGGLPMARAG
jgi:hypothetical protein